MRTKITESSKFLRCPIRKKEIADTPEERVRQLLIRKMVGELGYPKGLIAVEKQVGTRRFDLVCYTQKMEPLLLIECKAEDFKEEALSQALGYNWQIQAPFICVASAKRLMVFWHEEGKLSSVSFLPTYGELYAFSQRV